MLQRLQKKQKQEHYVPGSGGMSQKLPDTSGLGGHSFNDVYCMEFPEPEKAMVLIERFYAHNTAYLA